MANRGGLLEGKGADTAAGASRARGTEGATGKREKPDKGAGWARALRRALRDGGAWSESREGWEVSLLLSEGSNSSK